MKILSQSTPLALWQDVVHEAEAACETILQHELEAYLVILLNRYTLRPEMVKQVMATNLMTGLQQTAKTREFTLQGVGDTCLLLSGLFPGQAAKRLVKVSYFVGLGQGAYHAISRQSNDLYDLLSQQFVSIMDILQSIRGQRKDQPDLLPLEAYDLWNDVGSQRALKILRQYSTATPVGSSSINEQSGVIKLKS